MREPAAQRFAAALARARGFLAACGSAEEQDLLAAWLGEIDPAAVRAQVESRQGPDGAFAPPPGRSAPGPLTATLEALLVLGELRVHRAASVERAVAFLAGRQAADGSWSDAPAAQPAARLATTALVAGALAQSVYARPRVLAAAGDFLARHFDAGGEDWQAVAGLCAFFSSVDHEAADRALQWSGRALERGFRGGRFRASQTARVLTLCDAVGMPGAALDPGELVLAVLGEQADDGGWPGAREGDAARVRATLDAVGALLRLPS